MSELLRNIFNIKRSKPYIDYNKYHQGNIFGITKMSRRELMHSNFIAWALNPNGSHKLEFFPIYQFVRALNIIQDKQDNCDARKMSMDLVYKFYDDNFIKDVYIHREFPVQIKNNTNSKTSTKYIDILIEISTKEKILPIIIENKVESKENGKDNDQTVVYYDWCENERYIDRSKYFDPIYVYLFPEYNKTKQKSEKYLRMTYQELVDYILEPSMDKCGDSDSINNYRSYLQCLSFQSDNDKGEDTMAISSEEKKILDEFIKENKDLICAVIDRLNDEIGDPSVVSKMKTTVKDYSKYQFDGDEYNKSRLVLAMVQRYLKDNPLATYSDLESAFPIKFSSKPWVRLESDIAANEFSQNRVFSKDGITLADGTKVYVNNQVKEKDVVLILQIADGLGYIINKL